MGSVGGEVWGEKVWGGGCGVVGLWGGGVGGVWGGDFVYTILGAFGRGVPRGSSGRT